MAEGQEKASDLERYIGMKIKKARLKERLKLVDLARMSGISQGMVSKIENAQAATSLDTLSRLCDALGLPISQLFNDYDRPDSKAQLIKEGEGLEVVRRGTDKGHTYHLLSYQRGARRSFEPFLITLGDKAEVFPSFSHPGQVFMYMLEGRVSYRHGNQLYHLEVGDSLMFDAEVPHGPEILTEVPIRFLSVVIYDQSE